MDRVYLQEAFHAMELLEEEDFSLEGDASVKDILDFKKADELNDMVDIIDPDADDEEELEDTYIGKVILECEVCHSPIFKDVEDVVIDEDSDLANEEDECPICHSNEGFTIIGQVCPFEEESEIKVEVEDKEDSDEDEEDEIDDDFDDEEEKKEESLKEELDPELEEKLDELKDEIDEVEDKIDAVANEICPECEIDEIEEPTEEEEEEVADELADELGDKLDDEEELEEAKCAICGKEKENPCVPADESLCESEGYISTNIYVDSSGSVVTNDIMPFIDKLKHEIISGANIIYFGDEVSPHKKRLGSGTNFEAVKRHIKSTKPDNVIIVSDGDLENQHNDDIVEVPGFAVGIFIDRIDKSFDKDIKGRKLTTSFLVNPESSAPDIYKKIRDAIALSSEEARFGSRWKGSTTNKKVDDFELNYIDHLREGFEKVDLEMEDKIIHVSEEEKEPISGAEMITPVSDELANELTAPEDVEVENSEMEAPIEEVPMEEPVDTAVEDDLGLEADLEEKPIEDEETEFEESLQTSKKDAIVENCKKCKKEDDMVDYDIEDFAEEEFDKLGEAYLKRVYENVNSFKTDSICEENDKLVVEGIIKFNSGKEKATKFIFEAKDATQEGRVRFIGENAQISRGKKSFTLSGRMNEGKFIAESLNYNYQVNSNRVNGTVRVKD